MDVEAEEALCARAVGVVVVVVVVCVCVCVCVWISVVFFLTCPATKMASKKSSKGIQKTRGRFMCVDSVCSSRTNSKLHIILFITPCIIYQKDSEKRYEKVKMLFLCFKRTEINNH